MSKIERLSDDQKKENEDSLAQQDQLPLDDREVERFERFIYRKTHQYALWYYRDRENKPRGPANITTMRTAYINHVIDEDTIVYADGYEDWAPIKNVQELLHGIRTPEVKLQRWMRNQMCKIQGKKVPTEEERDLELKQNRWKYGLSPPTRKMGSVVEFLHFCENNSKFKDEFLKTEQIEHKLHRLMQSKRSPGNPVLLEEEMELLKLTPKYHLGGKEIFPHMEIMEDELKAAEAQGPQGAQKVPEGMSPFIKDFKRERVFGVIDQYLEFVNKVDKEGSNLDPEDEMPDILKWNREVFSQLSNPYAADEECPYTLGGLRAHKLQALGKFKKICQKFEENGYDYEDFLAKERFFQAYHRARFPNEELAGDDEDDRLSPSDEDVNRYLQQRAKAWAEIKAYANDENRMESQKEVNNAVQTAFVKSSLSNALDGFKMQPGVLMQGLENPVSAVEALELEKHFAANTYTDFLRKETQVFPRETEDQKEAVLKNYFDPLRRNAEATSKLHDEMFLVAAAELGAVTMESKGL